MSGELRIAARAVLAVLVAGGVGVGPLFALTKCNDAVTPPTCYYDRLITRDCCNDFVSNGWRKQSCQVEEWLSKASPGAWWTNAGGCQSTSVTCQPYFKTCP